MNNLNIIITNELGIEVYDTLKMITESRKIFINRFNKKNYKNIHYIQYIIIKSFYPNFFDNYNISIIKYSSRIHIQFEKKEILHLANEFKDIYNIANKELVLDLHEIITLFNSNNNTNKDKYKYLLYLVVIRLSKNIQSTDNYSRITFYPFKDYVIIDKDNKKNMYKCKIKDNLNKDLGYFLANSDIKEIFFIKGDILSKSSLIILQDYCYSNNINFTIVERVEDIYFNFSSKMIIIPESYYLNNLKNFFYYPGNFIFLL